MEKNCSTARIITISVVVVSIIVGMTISAFMLSRFMLRIQNTTEKSITVKGVAEKEVKADLASYFTVNKRVFLESVEKLVNAYKDLE